MICVFNCPERCDEHRIWSLLQIPHQPVVLLASWLQRHGQVHLLFCSLFLLAKSASAYRPASGLQKVKPSQILAYLEPRQLVFHGSKAIKQGAKVFSGG